MHTTRRLSIVFGILTTLILAACGGGTAATSGPGGPGGPGATMGGSATQAPGGATTQAPESGAPVVDRGRYLIIHRVEPDGQWRRAAEMFSPDRPPGPRPG